MRDAAERRSTLARVLLLAALFAVFALALKLPSLSFDHDEPDEVVYWSVARNLVERGEHTLRGAEVLGRLAPGIYDRPLFHHPPLYPALLVPFVAADAGHAAVIVSWLGHLLCILAVGLVGWCAIGERVREDAAGVSILALVLAGVATDPLLAHVGRRLWIDALVAGLGALSVAIVYVAARSRRPHRMLALAGIVLGLAGLAKLPGVLVGAVGALVVLGSVDARRERLVRLAWYAVPAVAVVLPWVAVFFATYGALTPTWLKPDAWALEHYPFVAAAVGRPWYYYAVKLCIAQPIVLVGLAAWAVAPRRERRAEAWAPLLWLVLILAVATWQGVGGYGFQMRYLSALVPSLYLLPLAGIGGEQRAPRRWLGPLLLVAVLWGAMQATPYLLTERYDELWTLPELARWIGF